jgi:hypothetical protein
LRKASKNTGRLDRAKHRHASRLKVVSFTLALPALLFGLGCAVGGFVHLRPPQPTGIFVPTLNELLSMPANELVKQDIAVMDLNCAIGCENK